MKQDKLISDLIDGMEGVKTVFDDLSSDHMDIYSFNCPPIDIPLGGGLASGRIYEIFGENSHGKSTIALEMVKTFVDHMTNVAKSDKYAVAWIESETAFDKTRARYMGCPVHRFVFKETDILEEGHKFIKQILERCVEKKLKLVIVWDTIAATLTQKEKDAFDDISDTNQKDEDDDKKGKSKTNPGGLMEKPRLIRQMLKDIALPLGQSGSTLILLNQVTTNKGTYTVTLDSSGGHGLKHYASVRAQVYREQDDIYKKEDGSDGRFIISNLTFKKNKLTGFTKYGSAWWIDVESGLDKVETRLVYMKKQKIVPPASGGWAKVQIPVGYFDSTKVKEGTPYKPDMVEVKYQNAMGFKKLTVEYPHMIDWFDYLMYMEFAKDSLVKVKNIDHIWEFEKKFFGERRTVLTDKEKDAAQVLFSELLLEADKQAEAEEAATKAETKKKLKK